MSNTPIDCACGANDVPDWNGKGQCITCARDAVLGEPQANTLDEKLISMFNDLTEEQFVVRLQALITEKVVKLANLYGEPRCENLHHAKKNQHTSIEDCPVEKAINEQLKEKL